MTGDRAAHTEDHLGYFRNSNRRAARTEDRDSCFRDGDRAARTEDRDSYGDRSSRTEDRPVAAEFGLGFDEGIAVGELVGFDEGLSEGESVVGFDQGIASASSSSSDDDDDDDVSSSLDFYEWHKDYCEVCGQTGFLLCCELCNIVSHVHCAGLQEEPPNDWMCAYCLADDMKKKHGKERRKATQASRECMKATVVQISPSSEDSLFVTSTMMAKTLPPTLPPTKTTAAGTTTNRKSPPPELEHPFKTIPANPELANQLVVIAKKLFKTNTIKVVLDDAGYSHRLPTNDTALFSSWPRADNDHVVTSPDEVRPVVNMTKDQILRAGLRTEGTRTRVCVTYAFLGVLTVALTADAKSAPPLIADLVPGHNQTIEFDKMSGSTCIDEGREFAKPLISESLRMRRAIFIEGDAGKKVVLDVIREEGLIVEYLTDEMIAERVSGFGNLRAKVGRSDHLAMLVSDAERTQSCYVFTCMQFASAVGGPQSAHRSGNFAIHFFHDWIRAFLIFANAPRHHIFPPYTTIQESLLNSFLFKVGAAKITAMLRQDGLIREMEVYLSSGEVNSGMPKRCNGKDPDWFVITPVNPETKLPMTDHARCSNLISAICTQLEEFGAMSFANAKGNTNGWVKEAKSNGKVIIEGANAWKERPSAKGKLWELRIMATKPPDVTLVDMVMFKELSKKKRATDDKYHKRKRDEAQGRTHR